SSNATLLVSALDHFAWAHIPSPQSVNVPFMVTVVAQDPANATVSNYNGSAGFSADSAAVAPPNSGGFALGHWTGSITITQAAPCFSVALRRAVNKVRLCLNNTEERK